MAKNVYVITSPENGWDCLIGVVKEVTDEIEKLCERNNWAILSAYHGVQSAKKFLAEMDESDYDEDEE